MINMFENNRLIDKLVFLNESNKNESVTINFYSWVHIIYGVIIFYGRKSEEEASYIINNTPMFTTPPKNFMEVCMLGHEDEYYWGMVMSHGDRYFEKGFTRTAPDDYYEWEEDYIRDHQLEINTLVFND